MKLVVVESPAKCAKIQSFLGDDYMVRASYGHFRNLAKANAIDVSKGFKPKYVISNPRVSKELKELASKADEVIIASDLDREGEAIGYHIIKILGLPIKTTKRLVFNQITKEAIQTAIKHPTILDTRLFFAQQARRVLDRLIGFGISPILWKHVASKLSAGRCQSPALRLVYDKECVINKFIHSASFQITGTFSISTLNNLTASFKTEAKDETCVRLFLAESKNYDFFVNGISRKESNTPPPPPFITSSLQQAASNKGISPKECMQHAQKLYEAGLITYMRTDSPRLANESKSACATFIKETYSTKFLCKTGETKKTKKTKGKNNSKGPVNAQDAHEAIRPVSINVEPSQIKFEGRIRTIYDIIWKRTLASQMADKITSHLKWTIFLKPKENKKQKDLKPAMPIATSKHTTVVFDGWTAVYGTSVPNPNWEALCQVKNGTECLFETLTGKETHTSPPPYYTEAHIIKELEKCGIGRPSTFSSIISTIVDRNYVRIEDVNGLEVTQKILEWSVKEEKCKESSETIVLGAQKKRLLLTEIGRTVVKFLNEHFNFMMEYTFTSNLECTLDNIALGNEPWNTSVQSVYDRINQCIENLPSKIQRLSTQKKSVGKHPTTDKNVYVFIGKKGKVIQHGEPDSKDTTYTSWSTRKKLENITLENVLEFIPKKIGEIDGKDVIITKGPYGIYLRHGSDAISIPSKDTVVNQVTENITLDECRNYIESHHKNRRIVSSKIVIRKGPYGYYIQKGKTIRSLPSEFDWETVSEKDCLSILAIPKKMKKRKFKNKSPYKKKKNNAK